MQVNEREGEDETAMSLYLEAANAEPKLPEDQQRICTAGLVLAMARCKELERSIHLALELDDPTTTLKLAEMLEQQDLPQVTPCRLVNHLLIFYSLARTDLHHLLRQIQAR